MAEPLKTRLTDAQIAALVANLPLADIIGKHEDHRLKEIADEIVLTYNLAPLLTAAQVWAYATRTLSALQFTPYKYGPTSLANGGNYVPPNKTIVLNASLGTVVNAEEKFYFVSGYFKADSFLMDIGANGNSIMGWMYCDGTANFYQNTGAAADLRLEGLTMA